jgi:protein-S-isoprenylcysteine O-methyltransferase Ste14
MTSTHNFDLSAVQHRRKRVVGASLVAPIMALLFTQSMWVIDGPAHLSIEWIGLALIVVCILGRTWCALYLGGKKKRQLVRHGPYSIVRNPLYLFSAIGAAGVGLCAGSLVIGAIFGAVCVGISSSARRRHISPCSSARPMSTT